MPSASARALALSARMNKNGTVAEAGFPETHGGVKSHAANSLASQALKRSLGGSIVTPSIRPCSSNLIFPDTVTGLQAFASFMLFSLIGLRVAGERFKSSAIYLY